MWHSCRNILPTKNRLKTRGIVIKEACDQCGMCESPEHGLWSCSFAAEVWGESRLKLLFIPYPTKDFMEVVWEIRDRKPEVDWECFTVTARGLWNHRNTIRHGGQRKTATRLIRDAEELLKEFHQEPPLPLVSFLLPLPPLGHLPNRAGIKLMWMGLFARGVANVVLVW